MLYSPYPREWLLFSDADVHYGPQSLRRAISFSLREELGFLTVIPVIHARGVILQALIAQFIQILVLTVNLRNVSDPKKSDCIGGGAFNLIRRTSYDQSEGLKWLKLDVIDDTGMALLIKRTGAKLGVLGGLGEIELEWYPSVRSFVCGFEKNGFAFFQYSLIPLFLFILASWLFALGFIYAPFASKTPGLILFVGMSLAIYLISMRVAIQRLALISVWTVILFPAVLLFIPIIALRSAVLFIFHGGIFWRGTFYSRSSLIQNQRLKPIDLALGRTEA